MRPTAEGSRPLLAFAAGTAALCTAYVAWHLARGWLPHDDGTLALSAERVLRGELPHRDFDDLYTGGLAAFQALALGLLGNHVMSMRWEMLAVFAAWVPAVFYVASRFVPAGLASAVAVMAAAWSVPNYNVPMPSWYNLFLATFGLAALLAHVERPRAGWLAIAGLCGGLSFLVKSIGIFYVAGAMLVLVHHAHAITGAGERRTPAYATFVTLALAAFILVLARLVAARAGASELYQHVLPATLLCAPLLREAWRGSAASDAQRFAALARALLPFLAGVAIPVALFLVPYAMSGALASFVHGVFVVPARRLVSASYPMPPLWTVVGVLPLVALIALAPKLRERVPPRGAMAAGAVLAMAIIVATAYVTLAYQVAWWSIRNLLPVLAAVVAWLLWRGRVDASQGQRLYAVVAVAALCNLVQFPFAVAIYFCYVAPLVLLAAVAVARPLGVPRALLAGLVVFYAAFAVLRLNTAPIYYMGGGWWPWRDLQVMQTERARGIESLPQFAFVDRLTALLREHGRGDYIWASPDCPEVYYLAGFSNPTRSLFEFFDAAPMDDAAVLAMLEGHGIAAIALNSRPEFSAPIRASLYRELVARYPRHEDAGPFQVRWRE